MSTVTAVPIPKIKRRYLVYLWLGIVLAAIAAVALAMQGDDFMTRNARASGVTVTASGLEYKVLAAGKPGPHPTDTDVALINYQGKLLDGKTFDQSQQPTPMPVSGVVPGFSEALKLMPKGAKYRFWIPSNLGYGPTPPPGAPIPPNATLVFDVEMLDFLPQSVVQQMQAQAQAAQMQGQMPPGAGAPPAPPAGQ